MTNKNLRRGVPRPIEMILAAFGLAVVFPMLLVSAALIRLNSRGQILFRQTRIGLNGKPFTLIKLRTMTISQAGGLITGTDDPRVTSWVKSSTSQDRRTPQPWNVLAGEMSFVGPSRVPEFVDLSDPLWSELTYRPGITDRSRLARNEERLRSGIDKRIIAR